MDESSLLSAPGQSRRASRRRSVIAVGGALVVVAGAAIVVIGMRSSTDGLAGKAQSTTSSAPATSTSPTSTDPTVAVIGLTVDQATTWATANGYTVRVVEVDGVGQVVTMDYKLDRINLVVAKGVVTSAKMG
jgi:hypothetical protein